jgi:hypothetical protein
VLFVKLLYCLEILTFLNGIESPEFGERCTDGAGEVAESVEGFSINAAGESILFSMAAGICCSHRETTY